MYTNSISLVVVCDADGNLEGFNVMVGRGMDQTHNKEIFFTHIAYHLGFVPKEGAIELQKSILALQRDYDNFSSSS